MRREANASAAQQARDWRANLPRGSRRSSDWRGTLIFSVNALLYILFFVGAFRLPTWWLRLASISFLPWVIAALFIIGHDACHGSLVRTGWLNRVLGRLCFLPAWHPYTSWAHYHNTLHHGGTNLKGREPAFPPLTKEEYDRLPAWRRLLERVYRAPAGVGLYYIIDFFGRRLIFPAAGQGPPSRLVFQLDRLTVAVYLGLQFATAWFLAADRPAAVTPPAAYAALVAIAPWLAWIWVMGFVSFVQHTHPRVAWYDREEEWSFYHVQLKSTTHVVFPFPFERVLHNIMDHPAHHIDPGIPLYELPRSQRLLEAMCPTHAVVVRWTPGEYFRTCAACKLYDFRRDCWTDFRGNPTTPTGLRGLARVEDAAEGGSLAALPENEPAVPSP